MMRAILLGLLLVVIASPLLAQTDADSRSACENSDPNTAIKACSVLIGSQNPTASERAGAYYRRGYAYGAKGLYEKAIADLSQAIALKPDAFAYQGRAAAYEHKGLHDQAIADDTAAIMLKPDFVDALENRGVAYDQKGRYDQAVKDYTQAILLGPGVARIYFNRGAAYEHRRAYSKAVEDYRASLKLDPSLQASKDGLKRLGSGR